MRKQLAVAGWRRPARFRWGAWLAFLALTLNALVPVHIAFDLAEDLAPSFPQIAGSFHSPEWRVLAFLTGHFDADGKSHPHHKPDRTDCPVCNSLGMLAGFAPAALIAIALPSLFVFAILVPVTASGALPAPAAAYRSRAPPLV